MARGVHQDQLLVLPQGQQGLLGEYGDAPLPLQLVGVQIGVPVVHPAQAAQLSPGVEQGLVQGGLARVHMGHHAHAYVFRCHNHLSLPQIYLVYYASFRAAVQSLFPRRGISSTGFVWTFRANWGIIYI